MIVTLALAVALASGDTHQSVRPPSFSAPAGWAENSSPSVPESFTSFGEWGQGPESLGVMGAHVSTTLDRFVAKERRRLNDMHARVLESARVRLCQGTRNGWRLSYTADGTNYVEIVDVARGTVYEAYYYSTRGLPGPEALASLTSLCGS